MKKISSLNINYDIKDYNNNNYYLWNIINSCPQHQIFKNIFNIINDKINNIDD